MNRSPSFPEGRQVSLQPPQGHTTAPSWTIPGFTIRPVATLDIEALILDSESYYFDSMADVSPLDLTLGWGPMSDGKILNELDVYQSDRSYYWTPSPVL